MNKVKYALAVVAAAVAIPAAMAAGPANFNNGDGPYCPYYDQMGERAYGHMGGHRMGHGGHRMGGHGAGHMMGGHGCGHMMGGHGGGHMIGMANCPYFDQMPAEFQADYDKIQELRDNLYVKKQVLQSLKYGDGVSEARIQKAAQEVVEARRALRDYHRDLGKRMSAYYSNMPK